MVKITGAPNIKLSNHKKNAFSGFCQKFPQAMHDVEKFFLTISKSLDP